MYTIVFQNPTSRLRYRLFLDTALVSRSCLCHYHITTCVVMSYSLESVPDDVIRQKPVQPPRNSEWDLTIVGHSFKRALINNKL